jgi:hypothetical protein
MWAIHGVYFTRWYRWVYKGKKRVRQERKEEHRTVTLDEAFRRLRISDKHASLVELTISGMTVVERLFERYQWYQKVEEEKAKKRRQKEYAAKRRTRRVKNHEPTRVIEV